MYSQFKEFSKKSPMEQSARQDERSSTGWWPNAKEFSESETSIAYLDILDEDDVPQNSEVVLMPLPVRGCYAAVSIHILQLYRREMAGGIAEPLSGRSSGERKPFSTSHWRIHGDSPEEYTCCVRSVNIIEDDPTDNRFLECALAADAEFVATGTRSTCYPRLLPGRVDGRRASGLPCVLLYSGQSLSASG